MVNAPAKTANVPIATLGVVMSAYGFLANLLYLHGYAKWAYGPTFHGVATNPIAQAGVAAVAGLCFGGLTSHFLNRLRVAQGHIVAYVLKGLICGIAATFIALEVAAIGGAGYIAYHTFRDYGNQAKILLAGFSISMLSVQAIVIPPALLAVPFAAIYGALGGGAAFRFNRRTYPRPDR